MSPPYKDPELRFARKIEIQDGDDPCWVWTGYLYPNGYGSLHVRVSANNWRTTYAHRVAYELFVGSIPEGLQIDHLCRNRACVNPDHLEPVTRRENLLRGIGFAGKNAAATHCKYGHEFTPENTYEVPTGGRSCRTCRARISREVRIRKKAAA